MHEGELQVDHQVTFTDGETLAVRLIGSNSGYLFYVPENARQVSIAPIKETVRRIERLADPGTP